jgi:hypothetical protein
MGHAQSTHRASPAGSPVAPRPKRPRSAVVAQAGHDATIDRTTDSKRAPVPTVQAERGFDPAWRADYRATRPKVERKLGHLLRRRHGGRRARVRGLVRVDQDWRLLAAAVNLARLAALGLHRASGRWQVSPA